MAKRTSAPMITLALLRTYSLKHLFLPDSRFQRLPDQTALSAMAAEAPACWRATISSSKRSEEHTSELQSPDQLVCRLLLEKQKRSRCYEPRQNMLASEPFARPASRRSFWLLLVRSRPYVFIGRFCACLGALLLLSSPLLLA